MLYNNNSFIFAASKVESMIVSCNKKDFLSRLIDLVSIISLPKDYHLGDRQKEFLVYSILFASEGIALESTEMVNKICDVMTIAPDNVWNYRRTLKGKGWLIQTPTGLSLLSPIDITNKPIPKELSLTLVNDNT